MPPILRSAAAARLAQEGPEHHKEGPPAVKRTRDPADPPSPDNKPTLSVRRTRRIALPKRRTGGDPASKQSAAALQKRKRVSRKKKVGRVSHEATETTRSYSSLSENAVAARWVSKPLPADCILGRGKKADDWPGNKDFRRVVADFVPRYQQVQGRREKKQVQREIVHFLKESSTYCMRFVRQDPDSQRWNIVSDDQARIKVGQQLRYQIRENATKQSTQAASLLEEEHHRSQEEGIDPEDKSQYQPQGGGMVAQEQGNFFVFPEEDATLQDDFPLNFESQDIVSV